MVARIAVVEPLPMFRRGIAAVLTEDGHTVEVPADVVAWVRQQAGTLVLLTVESERGWELLGRLAGAEGVPVIAVLDDLAGGARAVRAGARSVLPRDVTDLTLRRTVAATIDGQAVMPAAVAAALADSAAAATPSVQQLSWLRLLANGSTVGRLADETGYSERAMFRLLQALYRQMGVTTRIEAIMRAKEAGWL